jgi:hypothetical protein
MAGVTGQLREAAIIGHESEFVSRNYTLVDDATKRKAIQNLPHILGGSAAA